jgi:alpha-mannosidase|tara:strand:- start:15772 stop:18849 length:3078 start_codon:yes stop_codon:yes gene_type:complete
MLKHQQLTERRIAQAGRRILETIYRNPHPLAVTYYPSEEPLTFDEAQGKPFSAISIDQQWGSNFSCAWFHLSGKVPLRMRGQSVVALVDLEGEGCVFDKGGNPRQGLTARRDDRQSDLLGPKKEIKLYRTCRGGEEISISIDAGANQLLGGNRSCHLRQAEVAEFSETAWQLYHEYRFLELTMLELKGTSRHRQLILRCLNDVCNMLSQYSETELEQARRRLRSELRRPAKDSALNVSAIGHAHIDVAWLWPLRETVRKCARTFATALRMMEEYPDYRFGASQPQLYQFVKTHYPKLYRQIKGAIAAGRWEVQGGMWVESDCNIPSGESLVRQILHGKRFFMQEFGIEVNHLWLPDVFGYSAALPQILKKSRIDYFTTHKLNWNQFNRFPHHTMQWRGLDGTEIFAHFLAGNGYNVSCTPHDFINFEAENRDVDRSDHALCLFGIGDGGGGPGRTHIEWAQLATDLEDLPKVKVEFAREFFTKAQASARDLLSWDGELYFEYHRGTYTTQALCKRMNRKMELLARDTELAWSHLPLGRYPARSLDQVWKSILLNQFHDIIPGSSIRRVYKEAHQQYEQIERTLNTLLDQADAAWVRSVDSRALRNPWMIRNSMSWRRRVTVLLPKSRSRWWRDSQGRHLLSQTAKGGMLVDVEVPALGHVLLDNTKSSPADAPAPDIKVSARQMENDLLRIRFARDGSIDRIYDKSLRREVLAAGQRGNRFCLFQDQPLAFEAWDIDAFYMETKPSHPVLMAATVVESGPLRSTLSQVWEGDRYKIEQRISLSRNSRLIEFDTSIDWRQSAHMLRVAFPVNVRAAQAHYEIQFGHLARPTHMNTSWDMARFEVVAHKWADISQPNYGVAIINDCKYGHQIHGNVISLNLLRSPKSPDPEADMHTHEFRYALLPHPGDHIAAHVPQQAYEFNVPARVIKTTPHRGSKAASYSLLNIDAHNVFIDTVKKSEDGRDIIIRCYEAYAMDCTTRMEFDFSAQEVIEVDILEDNGRSLPLRDNQVKLTFSPFEIKTLRVRR